MSKTNITIDFSKNDLWEKLKDLLDDIPKDITKELISTYYSYAAQQHVNDKEYEKISKLEWLVDLYNLLN